MFLNPIELLELQTLELESITNDLIKRRKKFVLAEIELSDDKLLDYKGIKVTKSDIEKVLLELEDKENIELYHIIANSSKLNSFLICSDDSFFSQFKQESYFKWPRFVNLISKYFADSYNKILCRSFVSKDYSLFQRVVSVDPIVNVEDLDKCYSSVVRLILESTEEIDEINNEIKNEEDAFDEDRVSDIYDLVIDKLDVDCINFLPNTCQHIRNKCAKSIRNLSVNIFNAYDDSNLSLDLITYALDFESDSFTKQQLQKDFELIKRIYDERKIIEENAPILKKFAELLLELRKTLDSVAKKELRQNGNQIFVTDKSKSNLYQEFRKQGGHVNFGENGLTTEICEYFSNKVNVDALNSLNEKFIEVKDQIALALNALSVSLWNNYSNIDASIYFIDVARSIRGLSSDVRNLLNQSKTKLTVLRAEIRLFENQNSGESSSSNEVDVSAYRILEPPKLKTVYGIGTKIYKDTLYFVFLNIPLWPLGRYYLQNCGTYYQFYYKISFHTWQTMWRAAPFFVLISAAMLFATLSNKNKTKSTIPRQNNSKYESSGFNNDTKQKDKSDNSSSSSKIESSKYKGNQLSNGDSPLDNCFGKGKYGGPSYILFNNSNQTDAIVCLVNQQSNQTIRNEYIRKGMSYKMKSIPSGTYYLKCVTGNDWNPNLENICGRKGNFQSDVNYTKSDDPSDYIKIYKDKGQYSYYEITLYVTTFGNMQQEPISESEFFK